MCFLARTLAFLSVAVLQTDVVTAQQNIDPIFRLPQERCPTLVCVPACLSCPGQECTTELSFFDVDGERCQGCPVMVACLGDDDERREPPPEIEPRPPRQERCPVFRCADPCLGCSSRTCTSTPQFTTLADGTQCESCAILDQCLPAPTFRGDDDNNDEGPCCHGFKPPDAECGRSGCTCCSNGAWVKGNSGPNRPAAQVCGDLGFEPAKRCERKCCNGPRPSNRECGLFGCKCCSNGTWVARTAEHANRQTCQSAGLRTAPKCKKQCCNRASKPSRQECGRGGCRCCSDGNWITLGSGPTVSKQQACNARNLRPGKVCK